MKYFHKIALLACVLAFALLVVVMCCGGPQPLLSRSLLESTPYEGFGRMHDLEYTTYPANTSADSPETKFSGAHTESGEPVRLPGYAGLQTSPGATFMPLDIYSQASGSKECVGNTLTNSMGPLCLNSEQTRLLRTRGGNLTGGDSQIG